MVKIALCFAGLPRLTPETEISWQRFLDRYDVDVFVHTWAVNPMTPELINMHIVKILSPKLLVTSPARVFNTSLYTKRIWPHRSEPKNVLSMWYSINQSINLCLAYSKEKQINYDIVCRARLDWWCSNLDIVQNDDVITVPYDMGLSGHRFKYNSTTYTAHNDQFGYGCQKFMSEYASTFYRIPTMYLDDTIDFCSELLLTTNLIKCNIPIAYQPHLTYRMSRI